MSVAPRHFLTLLDLTGEELQGILRRAAELKALRREGARHETLHGRVLGMVFEKSSTRTRVSFESGMSHLGGHAIFLSSRDAQLGRGEPIEDTARVLSRMVDAVVVRTYSHAGLERFARYSSIPVVNALTDRHHPCQLLADVMTFMEYRGEMEGRMVAWVGDGNNVCNSFVHAARRFGFFLRIACPPGHGPMPEVLEEGGENVSLAGTPREAASDADLVVTDVWASMGQEDEQLERAKTFAEYRVDDALLGVCHRDAIVMHCLPAHRGEEISAEVLEGPRCVVWDEAENRLHTQKALLEFLLGKTSRDS
jgi:ornithine carbamoyltransferase